MTYRTASEDAALDRLLTTGVGVGEHESYGDDPDQVCEWWGPPGAPVVVVVHGGYFRPTIDRTHARPMAAALASAGHRVALLEYRRRPGQPTASVDDLERFDRHLRARGEAPAAWVGHSAGGTLVLLQGLADGDAPDPRGVAGGRAESLIVALAPVADLARAARERLGDGAVVDWMGGLPGEVAAYRRLDPRALLDRGGRVDRLTVLHGEHDGTVPAEHTRDLPVRATILSGAHHFDVIDPESPHFRTVLAALSAHTDHAPGG
ncbi:alpha/beta hydrolase family protein [Granulicoccus sp. GXG6511]|uniref:alpha/beta hydrolase family protein n=1 Tax=Granulicoccus sp. GXG6511 TaxID=3381351 RepID=UPI003D7DFF9D